MPVNHIQIRIVLLLCALAPVAAKAQSATVRVASLPDTARPEPIKDNSFLIEEAYNQDAGVVQHISTFSRPVSGAGWAYSFTQEWPVGSMRHQLSYTLPVLNDGALSRATSGLGDIAIHYRYQLAGAEGGKLAVAPRLSLLFPTGNAASGMGAGGAGVQAMLPASVEVGERFALHGNMGFTHTPHSHNADGDIASTTAVTLGSSVVWLATSTFNVLVETSWNQLPVVVAPGTTSSVRQFVVSPGVRYALNLPRDVQIVPGIAYVIGVGPSRGQRSVFLYTSVEHPFGR
jgi:hypothetical protein